MVGSGGNLAAKHVVADLKVYQIFLCWKLNQNPESLFSTGSRARRPRTRRRGGRRQCGGRHRACQRQAGGGNFDFKCLKMFLDFIGIL